MVQQGHYTYIGACLAIIQRYIHEHKGVIVPIRPPYGDKQIELFIKALNIACAYYGIVL